MAQLDTGNSLILAPPLEQKLIAICSREGLVDLSEGVWSYHRKVYDKERINAATRSHIFASVFLHPHVKLKSGYEGEIPLRSDLINLAQDAQFDFSAKCGDIPLFLSYCKAADPALNAERVFALISDWEKAHDALIQLWGEVPRQRGDGKPVLFGDFVKSAISRGPEPQYSASQLAAFHRYQSVCEAARVVSTCFEHLNSIWSRKAGGEAISIHPRLQRTYRHVLSAEDFEDGLTETDIFFLSIRALRTLPVGRTLKETLELSATPEGRALRQRVTELHEEVRAGGRAAIPALLARIERDADDYRALSARLESPNTLSDATDLALGAVGLIPLVGTVASGASILKSAYATYASHGAELELKKVLWAKYQGRSF